MAEAKKPDLAFLDEVLENLNRLQKQQTQMLSEMQAADEKSESSFLNNDANMFAESKDIYSSDFEHVSDLKIDKAIEDIEQTVARQSSLKKTANEISAQVYQPISFEELQRQFAFLDDTKEQEQKPLPSAEKGNENDSFSYSKDKDVSEKGLPPFPNIGVFSPPVMEAVKRKKPKKRLGNFISTAVFYIFLVSLIGVSFFISMGNKRPVFGYSVMNVLTWSMQSELPQGSMIFIKEVDPNTIEIGDDITYMQDEETPVTHRVIGITENFDESSERGFEMQGIENDTPDFEIVPAVNVVGKVVFHIPKLGAWLEWLREHLLITIGFTLGIVLLFVLLKGAFKKDPVEKKKNSKKLSQYSY